MTSTANVPAAHPVDEPCPPGCPTRLEEIAAYVAGWAGAYGDLDLTAADVSEALEMPAEARDSVQKIIAQVEESWV